MYRIIFILCILVLALCSLGYLQFHDHEPQVITKYVEVPVEKVMVVEKIVEVPVEVEKIVIKSVPIQTKEWSSAEHFSEWYLSHQWVALGDCDDIARMVQYQAISEGYPVSEALTLNGMYYGKKVCSETFHDGILVYIQGTYYWVEPDPNNFYIRRIIEAD